VELLRGRDGMIRKFAITGDLEKKICADLEWRRGLSYGKPRPGHPEGEVGKHICHVLENVRRLYSYHPIEAKLRLIAIIHDNFKYKVDRTKPKTNENHHGMIARRFAEKYITDTDVLDVIELHDEAYLSYKKGERKGKWHKAEKRIQPMIDRLGENIGLYMAFFKCDNSTGDKTSDSYDWVYNFVYHRTPALTAIDV